MRLITTILVAAALVAGLAGCKKVSAECEFVIKPRLMVAEGSNPDQPAYMVRVYAFYNVGKLRKDAERDWRPASYAEAESGIISHTRTGEIRSYSLMGEQNDEDSFVYMTLTSSPVMLVAVDPLSRFYAYGVFEYGIPMPTFYLAVHFKKWETEAPYKDGQYWTVVSAEYEEGLVNE